jgi:hypothetical protein
VYADDPKEQQEQLQVKTPQKILKNQQEPQKIQTILCVQHRLKNQPQKIPTQQRAWPTQLQDRQEERTSPGETWAWTGAAVALQGPYPMRIGWHLRNWCQENRRQENLLRDRRQRRENLHRYPCQEREKPKNHHRM